jgi:DNA polymerase-3 subunit gamma/tau
MSSLYLKYRPNTFEEIIGNENNKIILQGFLKQKEIPQVYLFIGKKGHGKTTFARIMANKLNCGENIYEINGSDNRGIDTARIINEQSQFKTLDGKNKCYILDEIHRATTDMMNAMLKVLEDTPKNVYFFLCTTEPEKLLKTIISRCKVIEVENIDNRLLYQYLIEISIKEKKEITKSVARKIAENSQGDLRQALNILESVLQFDNEEKQLEIIKNGIDDENKQIIDLCRVLYKADNWNDVRIILKNLQKENPESIRRVCLAYFNKILLDRADKRAALIIEALQNPIYDFPILTMCLFSIFC